MHNSLIYHQSPKHLILKKILQSVEVYCYNPINLRANMNITMLYYGTAGHTQLGRRYKQIWLSQFQF